MAEQREKLVFLAKLAEEAERYEDMIASVKDLAQLGVMLTVEERNLLSVAYKNVIGARRASWRVLSSIEQKESEKGESTRLSNIGEYRDQVEKELNKISDELLNLLEKHLLPNDSTTDGKVFYHKMAGDYYRYLAEFSKSEAHATASQNASKEYEKAMKIAQAELKPTDPIRLGLALNFSVFYYEIIGDQGRACTLAKSAFDEAIAELDNLKEDQYKDATLIMQLIRDNLTLWRSEDEDGPADDGTEVQDLE